MLSVATMPIVDICMGKPIDLKRFNEGVFGTSFCSCIAAIALAANRKCNFQPKWIWPAVVLIVTDVHLLELARNKLLPNRSNETRNSLDNGFILLTIIVSSVSFALLPQVVGTVNTKTRIAGLFATGVAGIALTCATVNNS